MELFFILEQILEPSKVFTLNTLVFEYLCELVFIIFRKCLFWSEEEWFENLDDIIVEFDIIIVIFFIKDVLEFLVSNKFLVKVTLLKKWYNPDVNKVIGLLSLVIRIF